MAHHVRPKECRASEKAKRSLGADGSPRTWFFFWGFFRLFWGGFLGFFFLGGGGGLGLGSLVFLFFLFVFFQGRFWFRALGLRV